MGIRTPDLLNAIEALYQLSYDPKRVTRETGEQVKVVGILQAGNSKAKNF
jgi:hypothetical protein